VPEVTADVGELFPRTGQLFLECSTDGRVVWMSDKARQRLGDVAGLLEHVESERLAEARRFLSDTAAPDTLAVLFSRADGAAVPVRFSCLSRAPHRIVLTAEVRERATDGIGAGVGAVNAELLWLQGIVLDNYFRVLRVQQSLDSRLRRHRNPGLLLVEQLERERSRLAGELHSSVGQSLSAISVHVELIQKQAPELPLAARTSLEMIARAAREAGAQVRAISRPLYSPPVLALPLNQALHKLWDDSGIPEIFQGSLTIAPLSVEPAPAVKVFLYRTAQEAFANVIRHAQATAFSLTLDQQDGRVRLAIEDNGQGFEPAAQPAGGGIGLRSIRDQAEALAGEFHLSSGPGGTKLEVSVPLEP